MKKSRNLRDRSFRFAVDIVRFCRSIVNADLVLRRLVYQLVDAAGSIGANLEESAGGQTKPDFIAKQFTSLKEARESHFWLRVIAECYPALAKQCQPHIQESYELICMLSASVITAKSNQDRGEQGWMYPVDD